MNEIAGLREAFKQHRIVFLTTFSDGGENSRQMTNLNENPYQTMWFPTYRNTQKIRDIARAHMDHTPDRVIINVKPESAKIVKSS